MDFGLHDSGVLAAAAPKRKRRSKHDVVRECEELYGCVLDEAFCSVTNRKMQYRCLRCDARLPKTRDCGPHHILHAREDVALAAARQPAGGLACAVDPTCAGPLSSRGVYHLAPASPGNPQPPPLVADAPSTNPAVGSTGIPTFPLVAPSPGSHLLSGGGHTASDDVVDGTVGADSEASGGGESSSSLESNMHSRDEDCHSDSGSSEWARSGGSASSQDESIWECSSSDGTVDDVGDEETFCNGRCWESRPPPGHVPVKRTGAWYHYHRVCPLLPGHDTTVMQACFSMCMLKDQHRVPDVVVDKICGYIHHVLLPSGNMFPPSYHLMKAVAAVPPATSTAVDVCDSCWAVYPHPPSDQHPSTEATTCDRCGAARYKDASHGRRVPCRQMYNFGARQTAIDLITRPGMAHAIVDSRREAWSRPESFWASAAGQALNRSCGGVFQLPGPNGDVPDKLAIAFTLGVSPAAHGRCMRSEGPTQPGRLSWPCQSYCGCLHRSYPYVCRCRWSTAV